MLIPEPRGHLSLTFSLVWINIISNVITVAICFLFLNQLAKITNIRTNLLMPFILLLVYLGTFAEKNAFEDLAVFLVFGALGWVMVKLDWQRPPLILGLVLGPVMENRLFLSTDNYGIHWLWRPGVLIFFAITLTGLFYPMLKKSREKKSPAESRPETSSPAAQEQAQGRSMPAVFFSLSLVVILALALWRSMDFGYRAGLFPWAIGFPVLALAIVQLGMELTGKTRFSGIGAADIGADIPAEVVRRRTAIIIAWIFAFYLALWLLGFSLAIPVTMFLYLKVEGREKWPITIILTLVAWGFFYGVFDYGLSVPFPDPVIRIPFLN